MIKTAKDIPYLGVDPQKIKDAAPRLYDDRVETLKHLIFERIRIYHQKEIEKKPAPWTDDPILRSYKFTNVIRMWDRESVWLLDNVIHKEGLSYENKVLNCFMFRGLSSGEAFDGTMGGAVDFENIDYEALMERQDNWNGKLQGNAYMLAHPRQDAYKICRVERLDLVGYNAAIVYFINKYKEVIIAASRMRPDECCKYLMDKVPSAGEFLSYQIWQDWCHIWGYPYSINEYTKAGPGSVNGMNWLVEDWGGLTPTEFLWWFRDNIGDLLGLDFKKLMFFAVEDERQFDISSCQNIFCEFNKYMKLDNNIKMRVRLYDGHPH